MILLYVNINFTVQNIGNDKNVIKCQSSGSVQEKLSKEGMPGKRASSLASLLDLFLPQDLTSVSLKRCFCLRIETVCLWPHRLFRGNGNGDFCCVAGGGKKGYMAGASVWNLDRWLLRTRL